MQPDGHSAAVQFLKLRGESAGDPQVSFVGDSSVDAHTKLITVSIRHVYERIRLAAYHRRRRIVLFQRCG